MARRPGLPVVDPAARAVRRLGAALLLAALIPALPAPEGRGWAPPGSGAAGLAAQSVVRVEVGATTFRDAYGSRIELWHPRLEGWLGLAGGAEALVGGQIRTRVAGLRATLGDLVLPLSLPTDGSGGAGLPVRGLSLADSAGNVRWRLFGGRIARSWSVLPGLVTSRGTGSLGLAEAAWSPHPDWDTSVRHGWTPAGRTGVATVERRAERGRVAASLGVRQGELFAAVLGRLRTGTVDLTAGWTRTGGRRVAADEFRYVELSGLNARLIWRPADRWSVHVERSQRQPSLLAADTTPVRTVYRGSVALPLGDGRHGRLSAHLSPDPRGGGMSRGVRAGVGGKVVGPIRANLGVFASRGVRGDDHVQASLTLRERIRPDLELLQRLDHAGDGWPSVSLGGRYQRGSTTIGVDYRTEFVPGLSGSQFRTALVVDVRLQLSGTTDLTASTYVDGTGQAHYRVQRGQWLYPGGRGGGERSVGPRREPAVEYTFGRQVVRGRVVLEDGSPVEGAAVEIGDQVLFTDGAGRFLLRADEPVHAPLRVPVDAFLLDRRYEVVSAPEEVLSREEEEAPEVTIVLRRPPPGG